MVSITLYFSIEQEDGKSPQKWKINIGVIASRRVIC